MEVKKTATRVTLLSVGILLAAAATRAGSGANRLYDQLNKIDRGY